MISRWSKKGTTDFPLLDEFRAAGRRNPRAFIEKKLIITNKDAEYQTLTFNESQAKVWRIRELCLAQGIPFYPLILKSRQRGLSTLGMGIIFAEAYNNDNINALVVAHLKERAEALFDMHHLMLKSLPAELQMPLSKAGKNMLKWEHNNSRISLATAGTSAAGRGGTTHRALLSEIGFYPDLRILLGALEQAIPERPQSMLMMESTANGTGSDFHEIWKLADQGKWDGDRWIRKDVRYIPIFLPWFDDYDTIIPETDDRAMHALLEKAYAEFPQLKDRRAHYGLDPRRLLWYYNTLADKCQGDELLMMQEYPCDAEEAFISSGNPIFPVTLTQEYRQMAREGKLYDPTISNFKLGVDGLVKAPDLKRNVDIYLEIWREPNPNRHYLISADGSEGLQHGDNSSAFVFDMVTQNIVAELHGHIEPNPFAKMLKELAILYNGAVVAPEIHGGGGTAVMSSLQEIYWNIYQMRKLDHTGFHVTSKLGFDTNPQTRPIIVTEGKRMFRFRAGDKDFIPSKALIDEIRTFVIGNMASKPVAANGCKDDRVMAWLIGLLCCLQEVGTMPTTGLITTSDSRISPNGIQDVTDAIDMFSNPKWTGQSFTDFYGSND